MNHEIKSDVDVIPVINVSLVIVLTMMLIAPLLAEPALDVELPPASHVDSDSDDRVEVTIAVDGRVAIEGVEMDPAEMRSALAVRYAETPGRRALVNADRRLTYGEVKWVLAELGAAGAPGIAIATEQVGQP